jgi:RNA polymerase sigma-70 factor (ECF subfamily)
MTTDVFQVGVEDQIEKDRRLVRRTQQGHKESFEELVQPHYQACLSVALGILHETADAQDVVQEAMWKALTRLHQYRASAPFSKWLIRIVVNQCLMLLRSRKQAQWIYLDAEGGNDERAPIQVAAETADPESETVHRERHDIITREMRNLPVQFRSVLVLRDVNECSMGTLAERLGISVGAAKSRLLRARLELKDRVVTRYGPVNDAKTANSRRSLSRASCVPHC